MSKSKVRSLIDSKIWLLELSIAGTTNKEKLKEYEFKKKHLESLKERNWKLGNLDHLINE